MRCDFYYPSNLFTLFATVIATYLVFFRKWHSNQTFVTTKVNYFLSQNVNLVTRLWHRNHVAIYRRTPTRIWRSERFCHKMRVIFNFCNLWLFKNVTFVILAIWVENFHFIYRESKRPIGCFHIKNFTNTSNYIKYSLYKFSIRF